MRFGVFALSILLLAGCLGAPELPLLSDVELAEDAPETGLVAPDVEAPETVLQELESVEGVPEVAKPEKPRRGLAALFGRRHKTVEETASDVGDEAVADVSPEAVIAADVAAPVATVEAQEDVASQPEPAAKAPRRERNGLFGPRRAKSDQLPQVEPGVVLPFGQIALACGVRGSALGKEVDRFPERGKGYRLFDTKPSTTGPRTHYITGFKDGCPRQFTASLALLESPVLHEQLLSVGNIQEAHTTKADIAFERIRAQVCRTGRGKACPEKRYAEMEKSMAFVTAYERFGGNAKWTETLLHKGAIAASSSHVK